jgi:hypothetical protein
MCTTSTSRRTTRGSTCPTPMPRSRLDIAHQARPIEDTPIAPHILKVCGEKRAVSNSIPAIKCRLCVSVPQIQKGRGVRFFLIHHLVVTRYGRAANHSANACNGWLADIGCPLATVTGRRELYVPPSQPGFPLAIFRRNRGGAFERRIRAVSNIASLNGPNESYQHDMPQLRRTATVEPSRSLAAFPFQNAIRRGAAARLDPPAPRYLADGSKLDAPRCDSEAFDAFTGLQRDANQRCQIRLRRILRRGGRGSKDER